MTNSAFFSKFLKVDLRFVFHLLKLVFGVSWNYDEVIGVILRPYLDIKLFESIAAVLRLEYNIVATRILFLLDP